MDSSQTPPEVKDYLDSVRGTAPASIPGDLNSPETPPAVQQFLAPIREQEKYSGVGQGAKALLEGAASGVTFGTAPGLEIAAGIATPEDIRGRAQQRNVLHAVGEIGGLGASAALIPGGGEAGALEAAGNFSGELLGFGAESAMKEAAQQAIASGMSVSEASLASKAMARAAFSAPERITSAAIKGAVEGSILSGSDEISKKMMQDPDQTVGSVATNGLLGLIGGGITGAGIGQVSEMWQNFRGNKTAAALNDVLNTASNGAEFKAFMEGLDPAERAAFKSGVNPSEIAATLGKEPLSIDPNQSEIFASGAPEISADSSLKANADDIANAADRRGVKLPQEALSNNENLARLRDNLRKRPTVAGDAINKEYHNIYNAAQDAASETLGERTDLSPEASGKEINEGLVNKFKKREVDLGSRYKRLENVTKQIDVSEDAKDAVTNSLLTDESVRVNPRLKKIADGLAQQVENLENVHDIRVLRTDVNDELKRAESFASPDPGAARVLRLAKSHLTDLRENAIEEASLATGIGKKGAAEVSSDMIQELRQLDSEYAIYKKDLTDFGIQAGIGKVSSTAHLLDTISKSSDQSWVSKIFDTNDLKTLQFFQKNHPEEFQIARKAKLAEIYEASLSSAKGEDGRLSVPKYLSKIKKIGPEAKQMLFGGAEGVQASEDAKLLYQGALPKDYNPSGTASAFTFGSLFTPQGALDNVYDGVKYAILKGTPILKQATGASSKEAVELATKMAMRSGAPIDGAAFKALVDYAHQTIKGETILSRAAKGVLEPGAYVLPQLLETDKASREKLDSVLKKLQIDPSPLLKGGGKVTHYLPDHGTAIGKTAMTAVNYLNSLRPSTQKQSPFDNEVKPSAVKQARFDRALDIAQKPMIALNGIKQGRVTPNDVNDMRTLFPGMYQNISSKIYEQIIKANGNGQTIPYKTRLGLSTFLGQPLDSTMTAQTRQIVQMANQAPEPQQPGMPQHHGQGPHSMKALSKFSAQFQTPDQARESRRSGRS